MNRERLKIFRERRAANFLFTAQEDWEEAHRLARRDSFLAGPEMAARERLITLQDKKRRLTSHTVHHSHLQATAYRLLSLLYPSDPAPPPTEHMLEEHPFALEVADLPSSAFDRRP